METIIIAIEKASDNNGYFYDIYADADSMNEGNSLDGGKCTTTMENAIDMASKQALEIIKVRNQEKKL